MTNKEFYNAVISAEINEEVTAKAQALLQKMTETNSARTKKKAEENAPLVEAAKAYLAGKVEPVLASEIAAELGVNTSKATVLAKAIEGIQIVEVKLKGRKVNGYLLPEA